MLAFEAIGLRAVAFFFEDCSGHSKARILGTPLQDELEMVGFERDIGIDVPDDFVIEPLHFRVAGIKGVNLGGKAPISVLGHVHHFDPVVDAA